MYSLGTFQSHYIVSLLSEWSDSPSEMMYVEDKELVWPGVQMIYRRSLFRGSKQAVFNCFICQLMGSILIYKTSYVFYLKLVWMRLIDFSTWFAQWKALIYYLIIHHLCFHAINDASWIKSNHYKAFLLNTLSNQNMLNKFGFGSNQFDFLSVFVS